MSGGGYPLLNNGFTLIELLAVIVILAIIALIATPIVLDIVESTKNSSTLRSAENYLTALEQSLATYQLDNKTISSGTYTIIKSGDICLGVTDGKECNEEDTLYVQIDGEKPTGGIITILDWQIIFEKLIFGEKIIIKNSNGELEYSNEEVSDDEVEEEDILTACTLVNDFNNDGLNIGDEYTCDPGDGISRTFYVLEDGDNPTTSYVDPGYVALIMNENLTQATFSDRWTTLESQTSTWTAVAIVTLPADEQIVSAAGYTDWNNEDTGNNLDLTSAPWLYTNLNSISEAVVPYSYWTGGYSVDDFSWVVYQGSLIIDSDSNGIRPVIYTTKINK